VSLFVSFLLMMVNGMLFVLMRYLVVGLVFDLLDSVDLVLWFNLIEIEHLNIHQFLRHPSFFTDIRTLRNLSTHPQPQTPPNPLLKPSNQTTLPITFSITPAPTPTPHQPHNITLLHQPALFDHLLTKLS
jgi:hypothetical protein